LNFLTSAHLGKVVRSISEVRGNYRADVITPRSRMVMIVVVSRGDIKFNVRGLNSEDKYEVLL
jgi:hypothetical protein